MILTVAIPVPLHKTFDYLAQDKDDLLTAHKTPAMHIKTGMRVEVPFAGRRLSGIVLGTKQQTPDTLPENYTLKAIIHCLDKEPTFPQKLIELISWSSQYYCHPIGECFHTALPTALRKPYNIDKLSTLTVIKWHRSDLAFEENKRNHKQARILDHFANQPLGIWQESLKLLGITNSQLNTLEKKGLLRREELDPLTAAQTTPNKLTTLNLNKEQQYAVETLKEDIDKFGIFLLHGITGSGKTEVYIERVKHSLAKNEQALILIPEINLTPQTLARFQSQLNTPIGLIHSGMSEKEKLTMWHLAKNGVASVIIGTRSAVFTPFKHLGCIIVDEEHDSSYKQNDGFKYSARDLAVKRAQIENCQIILGSATPSLESLLNANQKKYRYIHLRERAGAGQKPDIHLIDIKSRALENGCSRPLLNKIKQELDANNQIIIFQNRRGYSPTLLCNSCGWIALCPHCDARLTVHRKPPHLHCHHCDFKEVIPGNCKNCQDTHLSPLGSGTERIETGLTQRFPNTKIIRIDRDSIKKQQDMKKLVVDINKGEPCILIGTQMLAKGHDFHNVTLVAIIDADSSLFSSDFRAFEQSTQLLLQVSGRTGRGNKAGLVLIQTKHAEHPLFIPIIENNYDLAAKNELVEREACGLPPYSKMISIRVESPNQKTNFEQLSLLKNAIKQAIGNTPNYQLSGPLEASMSRKAGIYRSYLHIFTTNNTTRYSIQAKLPELTEKIKRKVKVIIDVDPHEYI
tara:strand:+ start:7128 stop:9356 length:2229 start_codon:yes stop_codon:yes gene_type:complete